MNRSAKRPPIVAWAVLAAALSAGESREGVGDNARLDSYRGIWFSIGQGNEHGPKYAGGLGTYTCSHAPMAIHAKAVGRTFFTWGGTDATGKGLRIMASWFDHRSGTVPRPTVVRDCGSFGDPHADSSIGLDAQGHVWVFCSQRHSLPGKIYRSAQPHDTTRFEPLETKKDFAYVSAWFEPGSGWLLPFTKYTGGRELYWRGSSDGKIWSDDGMLATGGHYHVSGIHGRRVAVAFNYHPKGNDSRTNLYYCESDDLGKTWRSADGRPFTPPLDGWPKNQALAVDVESQGELLFTHDLAFDAQGRPVVLFLTAKGFKPGPAAGRRAWMTARWTDAAWDVKPLTTSDHCWDTGCLHIEADGTWRVIGPTDDGPQPWATGGAMAMWISRDHGASWTKAKVLTPGATRNHTYARRPRDAAPGFYAFWADGDALQRSTSALFFTDRDGSRVWKLPERMDAETARPEPAW